MSSCQPLSPELRRDGALPTNDAADRVAPPVSTTLADDSSAGDFFPVSVKISPISFLKFNKFYYDLEDSNSWK